MNNSALSALLLKALIEGASDGRDQSGTSPSGSAVTEEMREKCDRTKKVERIVDDHFETDDAKVIEVLGSRKAVHIKGLIQRASFVDFQIDIRIKGVLFSLVVTRQRFDEPETVMDKYALMRLEDEEFARLAQEHLSTVGLLHPTCFDFFNDLTLYRTNPNTVVLVAKSAKMKKIRFLGSSAEDVLTMFARQAELCKHENEFYRAFVKREVGKWDNVVLQSHQAKKKQRATAKSTAKSTATSTATGTATSTAAGTATGTATNNNSIPDDDNNSSNKSANK